MLSGARWRGHSVMYCRPAKLRWFHDQFCSLPVLAPRWLRLEHFFHRFVLPFDPLLNSVTVGAVLWLNFVCKSSLRDFFCKTCRFLLCQAPPSQSNNCKNDSFSMVLFDFDLLYHNVLWLRGGPRCMHSVLIYSAAWGRACFSLLGPFCLPGDNHLLILIFVLVSHVRFQWWRLALCS